MTFPAEYPYFVGRLMTARSTHSDGIMHAAAGMAGEAGEVLDLAAMSWVHGLYTARDKLLEEVGDVLFYTQGLCTRVNSSLASCREHSRWGQIKLGGRQGVDPFMHSAVGATASACLILDAAKKHWVYDKPIDTDTMLALLADLVFYLENLGRLAGFTLEQAVGANMAKLRKRYPEGKYTAAAAIAQRDKLGEPPLAVVEPHDPTY